MRRRNNVFAWKKDPVTGGFSYFDSHDLMELYKLGAGHLTGNEPHLPYSRLGITYQDNAHNVICKGALYISFGACTTCCCTRGLILADKSLALTYANDTYTGINTKKTIRQFCSDWFTSMDPIVGLVFSIMRTTFNTGRRMVTTCT